MPKTLHGAAILRQAFFGNIHFALKGEVFIPALTLGLGLKGLLGVAEDDNDDFDLALEQLKGIISAQRCKMPIQGHEKLLSDLLS